MTVLPSLFLKLTYRVMRALHTQTNHAPLGPNKNLFRKTINITFIYLLASFIAENLKKILGADPEL